MAMPAIVLAAGASRRLGQPKQLLRIGSETMLERTVRVAKESGAEPILVVLGAHRDRVTAGLDLTGAHVVVNRDWEQGIASSIHAGINALQGLDPQAAGALLLVCDQPKLTAAYLRSLIAAYLGAGERAVAASEYAGVAGIPAIFPASQFAGLLTLEGDAGARRLLRNPSCPIVTLHFEGGESDVDLPSDLAAIEET